MHAYGPALLLLEWCDGGMLSQAIPRPVPPCSPLASAAGLSDAQMLGVARAVANGLVRPCAGWLHCVP